ncbi:MAG: DUF1351 domain-containing protein [Eubacteriales bacterium]|nr:DUF1351 domain-containing protein [Eubacteriales bacterium]
MALEMEIFSPSEDGYVKEIKWNMDEVAAGVAEVAERYDGLVFTAKEMPEAKKERANLNKLYKALDEKRMSVKKSCLAPYEVFEGQIKQVQAPIKNVIGQIDAQIKEFEEGEKEEKKEQIAALWAEQKSYEFLTLDRIWNDKWLNKSYKISDIKLDMLREHNRVGEAIFTIQRLGEDSEVALDDFKETLDITHALQARELYQEQKRKEAERRERERQAAELAESMNPPEIEEPEEVPVTEKPVKRMRISFTVTATQDQFAALNADLKALQLHAEEFVITKKEEL